MKINLKIIMLIKKKTSYKLKIKKMKKITMKKGTVKMNKTMN